MVSCSLVGENAKPSVVKILQNINKSFDETIKGGDSAVYSIGEAAKNIITPKVLMFLVFMSFILMVICQPSSTGSPSSPSSYYY